MMTCRTGIPTAIQQYIPLLPITIPFTSAVLSLLLNSTTRNYIGAVKGSNGTANTSFNPSANNVVYENYVNGNELAVCGTFSKINSKTRQGFARVHVAGCKIC
jgi:hypothetical protein